MSKDHSYAYEAGYRDGSINYELEHCPACKNVADLQEALAENAKLREEMKDVLSLLRLGARSGEGISREWCRERLDYYSDRMRDLGIEVGE